MENISFAIVNHKHVDEYFTWFVTTSGPMVNNPLGGFFGVIIRGTY